MSPIGVALAIYLASGVSFVAGMMLGARAREPRPYDEERRADFERSWRWAREPRRERARRT